MLGLGRTGETSAAVGTSGPALSNEVTPGGDRKDARALPLVSLHQAAVRLIKAICCRRLFTSSDFSFILSLCILSVNLHLITSLQSFSGFILLVAFYQRLRSSEMLV